MPQVRSVQRWLPQFSLRSSTNEPACDYTSECGIMSSPGSQLHTVNTYGLMHFTVCAVNPHRSAQRDTPRRRGYMFSRGHHVHADVHVIRRSCRDIAGILLLRTSCIMRLRAGCVAHCMNAARLLGNWKSEAIKTLLKYCFHWIYVGDNLILPPLLTIQIHRRTI